MKNIPITCEEFVREVSAFRDDELSLRDDARAREHLAACQKCRGYLRDYELTIELAKSIAADSAETDPLPEFLVQRIVGAGRR
jgi:predicted anti-sigma-YlaC factor YlaD